MPSQTDDHDRPLTPEGAADAATAGHAIAGRGWTPEVAIVSDSLRTRQTYDGLGLGPAPRLRLDGSIYEASPETILAAIAHTDDAVRSVLVIGHNPGIALTARMLATSGPEGDLARLRNSFPTATLAVLRFEAAAWSALADGAGRLEALIFNAAPEAAS